MHGPLNRGQKRRGGSLHPHLNLKMSNTIHLRVRIVGHWHGAFIHTRVFAIFHHANDGSPKFVTELMSDRIHAGHQFLDECLVDYGNAGEASVSVSLMSRPLTTDTPITWKKSGPTSFERSGASEKGCRTPS